MMIIGDLTFGEKQQRDSITIIGGKYTFTGLVKQPTCACIVIDSDNNNAETTGINIALENATITLVTDTAGWTTISGTPANDEYQAFRNTKRVSEEKGSASKQ